MVGADINAAILEQGQLLAHLRHKGTIEIDDGQAVLIAGNGERPPERVDGHALAGIEMACLVRGDDVAAVH